MRMVAVGPGQLADHAEDMAVPREVFCHIGAARPRTMGCTSALADVRRATLHHVPAIH
jgi:hypothetical protein